MCPSVKTFSYIFFRLLLSLFSFSLTFITSYKVESLLVHQSSSVPEQHLVVFYGL